MNNKMAEGVMSRIFISIFGQIIIIALITFLLGESVLRLYNHFKPTFIFYDDSYNRYRGNPHADYFGFRLNSRGFLDIEHDPQKKDNTYRILGIGDSFAFGVVPYKYNWLTLVGSELNSTNPKKAVELLNMGIPCTGPIEYLSLLIREELPLNPDMVMIAFFTGNDFVESKPARRPLYTHSYIITLLNYILKINKKMDSKIIHKGKLVFNDDGTTFDPPTFSKIERERSFIYIEGNKRFKKLFDRAVNLLGQINCICKAKGIKLVVVIIPDEVQVNERLQTDIRTSYYPDAGSRWNITLPNRMLTERLDSLGIDNLDLYPYFAKAASRQQLYKPRDTHWNIAGNQLAADVVQAYIRTKIDQEK